ncbi:MAG: gamma-glutamyltransferase [Vicinamibacterales bacterium]
MARAGRTRDEQDRRRWLHDHLRKATGKSVAVDGEAPRRRASCRQNDSETLNAGMKARIVPGNLGGYLTQAQRFGTTGVAEVFAPAIDAPRGYPIDPKLAR